MIRLEICIATRNLNIVNLIFRLGIVAICVLGFIILPFSASAVRTLFRFAPEKMARSSPPPFPGFCKFLMHCLVDWLETTHALL